MKKSSAPQPLPKRAARPTAAPQIVYRIKVTLTESSPEIWRRIDVLDSMTLLQLHEVLQIVMGWEDYHLHEFTVGGRHYGNVALEDDPVPKLLDGRTAKLKQIVPVQPGTRFRYLYDFGDSWHHELLVEGVLLADSGTDYPHCSAGERRGPPEDVGGVSGYERYLNILADPDHEEHEDMLSWRGKFDPEAFSVDQVNAKLRKRFRSRPRKSVAPSLPSVPANRDPEQQTRTLLFTLTGRECELIRDRSFAPTELVERLQPVPQADNHLAEFAYTWDELDELAGFIAAEGNHPESLEVGREWDALFERILALLNEHPASR